MQNEVLSIRAISRRLQFHTPAKVSATLATFALALATTCLPAAAQVGGAYQVTNLVSDGSVTATVMDAHFINPWAISASGTWWIATQGSGLDYAITTVPAVNFSVVVPAASGSTTAIGSPAGSVTTGGTTGMILPNLTKASFLFSTLDGTISGWNTKLGTAGAISQIVINNSSAGASYPGLAIINTATASYILAPNFGTGNTIEIYDGTFKPTKLTGTFTDPSLPAGYSPFSVHVLNNQVYIAYALRSAAAPYHSVDALGNGAVSLFDTSGNFIKRIATGGVLDSPWGVAIAPTSFGIFGGDILIGNFGNGLINAFDPVSFAWRGQLVDGTGKPISYASLWDLLPAGTAVGNTSSVSGGTAGTVYFSAGLTGEAHGLFGAIANNPTPSGTATFGVAASGGVTIPAGSSGTAVISIAPTNNFSGTVNLACTNMPVAATCSFAPAAVPVTATTSSLSTVTIQTTKMAALDPGKFRRSAATGITWALLLPFGCILAFRRRSNAIRFLGVAVLLVGSAGFIIGCGTNNPQIMPFTPTGTVNVIITASSGTGTALNQSTILPVTVQ